MDTTKFTMGIVGLVVIILMVTGAVIPAVQDAQNHQTTEMQNTTQTFAAIETDEDFTVTYVNSTNTWTVNGFDIPNQNNSVIVACDGVIIQKGLKVIYNLTSSKTDSIGSVDMTAEFSNGTVTYTIGSGSAKTATYTSKVYVASESGDYGIFNLDETDSTLKVTKGTVISAIYPSKQNYMSESPAWYNVTDGVADMENPVISLKYTSGGNLVDGSNVSLTLAGSTSDELPYYEYTAAPTASYSTGQSTVSCIGCYIAPLKYMGISSDDDSLRALLGIIPLLLIIVAVLYAVRLMGASRN